MVVNRNRFKFWGSTLKSTNHPLPPLPSPQKRHTIHIWCTSAPKFPILFLALHWHNSNDVTYKHWHSKHRKLHLNWHTPRAVVFGGLQYADPNLPEYYTDQGLGQLQLLIGHLKIQDEVVNLILVVMSYFQVHVGSALPFYHLPYSQFSKWVEHPWMASIWKFLSQAQLRLDIEGMSLPQAQHEHGIFLMDLALSLNLNPRQLSLINTCRLYLQVLTVADIVAADGIRLTLHAVSGTRDPFRTSSWQWPSMPRPPSSAWTQWNLFLQFFTQHHKLDKPLGHCTSTPHQQWQWYQSLTGMVYHYDWLSNEWFQYEPTELPVVRRTRQSRCTYQTRTPCLPPSMISSLLYTTLSPIPHSEEFTTSPGLPLLLPSPTTPQLTLWDTTIAPIWSNTPMLYQWAIGPKPPTSSQCDDIAEAIQNEALMACSDWAYDRSLEVGSQGWVFRDKIEAILATGSGPRYGNPSMMSSYRTELTGIVAVLYIIYRICQDYNIDSGKAVL